MLALLRAGASFTGLACPLVFSCFDTLHLNFLAAFCREAPETFLDLCFPASASDLGKVLAYRLCHRKNILAQ